MPLDPSSDDRMYRRLEVAPEASADQIGRAYRRLAHSHHPDTHPEDPDAAIRFREITEAYEILSDPGRRARYDHDRQPSPTSDFSPPRPAAKTNRIPVTPLYSPGQVPNQPMYIGRGPFQTGSARFIAGPVHVTPASTPHGAAPSPASDSDLAEFIDAVLRAWRWW
ncbi:MAG: J domain-containing protein [Acidimicrobiales bacterium]|nr:J domain-containing protein [Acidimicrobiales bacterium]